MAARGLRQVRRQRAEGLPRRRHTRRGQDDVRPGLRPLGAEPRASAPDHRRPHDPPEVPVGRRRTPDGPARRPQLVAQRRCRQGRPRHRHHVPAGRHRRHGEETPRALARRVRRARRGAPRRRRTGLGRRRAHRVRARPAPTVPQRHPVPQRHGEHPVRALRGDRSRRRGPTGLHVRVRRRAARRWRRPSGVLPPLRRPDGVERPRRQHPLAPISTTNSIAPAPRTVCAPRSAWRATGCPPSSTRPTIG